MARGLTDSGCRFTRNLHWILLFPVTPDNASSAKVLTSVGQIPLFGVAADIDAVSSATAVQG